MEQTCSDFYAICRFPKCIGALDCTHVKIKSPGGDNPEIYRNRKGYFSINVQTVCDASLKIQNIVVRWPGSTHDSTIFKNSRLRARFESGEFGDYVLVADSGYALKKYLLTKLSHVNNAAENLYNEALIRTRNTVERSYGVWKRRFPVLAQGMNVKLERVEAIVVATAVVHNIACDMKEVVPQVSPEIEELIDANNFNQILHATRNDQNVSVRNAYVAYFGTL